MIRVRTVVLGCLLGVTAAGPGAALADATAPRPTTMRLLDAATRRPLAQRDVEVASDNGVRCIRAPCPINAKSWKGRSDANGRVSVPAGVVQESTRVRLLPDGEWVVLDAHSSSRDVVIP